MARVRGFALLILVASPLLLGAAGNVNVDPHSKHDAGKVEADNRKYAASSSPIAATVKQTIANTTDKHAAGVTYNYNGTFKYVAPANPPEEFWKPAGEVAIVLSTILLAVFTGLLVCVTRDLQVATEAALHINRPFILIPKVARLSPNDEFVSCVYQNSGSGPADIVEIIARLDQFYQPIDIPPAMYVPSVSYSGPGWQISDPIIPAGKVAERPICVDFDLTRFEGVYGPVNPPNTSPRIAVHGRIKYRGGPPNEFYLTHFFYWLIGDLFFKGPEELNRRT